ncbi:Stk1 family PASTA domain-containing Ser/Thr kinase [Hominifimenecus sp. rT4P-3]|uniref:Stk1 family PASTA domain-containing Ser/Thr kinase n=1 Tax=Hominifimenecus sp. rT4P-3 TaxID=3242979 RepID=UPI003DA21DC3
MLRIGMFLGNRYEIISKIGSGGMSDVYKAKCHKLNRFVAIKVLKTEFASDQSFVAKFRMEAQSAACLSHPNIVNIYDVGEENGVHYIVMELIDGITLKKYIERKKKLEIRESIEVTMQVARGLEAAHREHIIHRDIKPQNIMISREGKVKVTDFGIARAASSQTISSNTMGSVHYISPEQARGGYCDERSDIYSLGITLYEMLTGRVPFEGDSTVAVALLHIQGEMVPPREYEPLIPVSLEKIILKCTQKKPERRYASATELIEDLKKCLSMPNGDFVKMAPLTNNSPTTIFRQSDIEQIKRGSSRVSVEEERRAEKAYQMGVEDEGDGYEDEYEDEYDDEYDDEFDEDDESDSHFEKIVTYIMIGVAVLIVIIVAAIGLRACGVFDFGSSDTTAESSDSTKVTMVNFVGKTVEEAEKEIKEKNLNLTIRVSEYIPSEEYAKDQIVEQDYKEGDVVDRSTTVTVKVSTGSNKLAIPADLEGKTEQEARRSLRSAGFTNVANAVQEQNHETIAAGTVIGTNPGIGSVIDKDAEIVLIVSAGPTVKPVEVPDLRNMSEESARAALEDRNLVLGSVERKNSDEVEKDLVISQSVEAHSTVDEGTTVNIVISKGSSSVKVPDVRWGTLKEAREAMSKVDLLIDVRYEYDDDNPKGTVIGQETSPGESVKKGETIVVIVSYGPEPTQARPDPPVQEPPAGDPNGGETVPEDGGAPAA